MQLDKAFAGLIAILAFSIALSATPRKVHAVALGAVRRVPYSKAGDPAGALTGEERLKIRPLIVDGGVKEWTTGDAHDVTDRSFVVRRVLRINDQLPGEKSSAGNHWVWQRGPWLTGRSRYGSCGCTQAAGLRSGREPGELVQGLCCVLRCHGERQEPLRGCCATHGAETCACEEALSVGTGREWSACVCGCRVAARAASSDISSCGKGSGEFRCCSGLGCTCRGL